MLFSRRHADERDTAERTLSSACCIVCVVTACPSCVGFVVLVCSRSIDRTGGPRVVGQCRCAFFGDSFQEVFKSHFALFGLVLLSVSALRAFVCKIVCTSAPVQETRTCTGFRLCGQLVCERARACAVF